MWFLNLLIDYQWIMLISLMASLGVFLVLTFTSGLINDMSEKVSKVLKVLWVIVIAVGVISFMGLTLCHLSKAAEAEVDQRMKNMYDLREKIIAVDVCNRVITTAGVGVNDVNLRGDFIRIEPEINSLDELKGMYLYRSSKGVCKQAVIRKE